MAFKAKRLDSIPEAADGIEEGTSTDTFCEDIQGPTVSAKSEKVGDRPEGEGLRRWMPPRPPGGEPVPGQGGVNQTRPVPFSVSLSGGRDQRVDFHSRGAAVTIRRDRRLRGTWEGCRARRGHSICKGSEGCACMWHIWGTERPLNLREEVGQEVMR